MKITPTSLYRFISRIDYKGDYSMVYTKSIEQADMMRLLDSLYDTAVNGVDKKHVIGEKNAGRCTVEAR